ncbi:MAG TPA: DUF885 domain-containing protein [Bryobacteraceae bacterium]|nr:DUF885 domain-containing protein [Bryobacteraceae bacterium]
MQNLRAAGSVIVSIALLTAGCGRNDPPDFSKLSNEFVYTTLAFSPSGSTAAGLHEYQGRKLDDLLDDFSPAALDSERKFYQDFRRRLAALKPESLSAEDRVDLGIIQDQISLALLELNEVHTPLHNPTLYVETLGNALFNPYVLEYAPKPARFESIIARLRKTPLYLDQAEANLLSSPDIWTKVAVEENDGNIELVDKTLRADVPAGLRDAYNQAAGPALDAMRRFQNYLKTSLTARNNWDWRLGRDRYVRKFRYTLESGLEADTVLANAEADLERVRARMLELALPLHRKMFPGHGDHANLSGTARENAVIGEVLDKIAERHATPETYMEEARKDLDEARAFVVEKHLLTMPTRANLQVIPTPEFMRGIYSVGGFSPAPALEPQLGAFYWVTPIPSDWPKQRIESKLREYNFYKLKLLTLHEAVPGHYVQLEFANDVQPKSRRVLRSVYGNGAYIEGWAEYAEQMMLDEGFLNHSPEMALTFAKEQLRVIANAILDIRLHTLNMSDQEALDLMEKKTFQESEEANGKLQRAKLSSCQLPTYFAGWRAWLSVREAYRNAKGSAYRLSAFHDAALRQGAVPLQLLNPLLQ